MLKRVEILAAEMLDIRAAISYRRPSFLARNSVILATPAGRSHLCLLVLALKRASINRACIRQSCLLRHGKQSLYRYFLDFWSIAFCLREKYYFMPMRALYDKTSLP